MKGDAKVIALLNDVLTAELTAINQYFLHARMCKNWGYERLAKKMWDESIEEMKHSEKVVDRILLLEGLPNLQKLDKLNIGEDVKEQLESDYALEVKAIERLRQSIEACYAAHDHVSRGLLESILADEEEHADWIEAQLQQIKTIGIENYLAEQIHS